MKTNVMIMMVVLLVAGILVNVPQAFAKEETSAVMSKSCDEAKIKELAGEALIKLEPKQWTEDTKGFNITLDTDKMSFADLTLKMVQAKCFE